MSNIINVLGLVVIQVSVWTTSCSVFYRAALSLDLS